MLRGIAGEEQTGSYIEDGDRARCCRWRELTISFPLRVTEVRPFLLLSGGKLWDASASTARFWLFDAAGRNGNECLFSCESAPSELGRERRGVVGFPREQDEITVPLLVVALDGYSVERSSRRNCSKSLAAGANGTAGGNLD
jgi:hypothetical protein